MIGVCSFCCKEKELTTHHLIAKKYGGINDQVNLIPNICRNCHDQIEDNIDKTRGDVGAGKSFVQLSNFMIGNVLAKLNSGSIYLDEQGKSHIDVGSPFYGISCHIKDHGQKKIEIALINRNPIFITGSPGNSWLIYSYANN